MKCILLSVLFLPFTALATPVSSGLPSAASSSARIYKLPGLVDSGTSENGADANDPKEPEYCPVPKPGPHITPIDIGASPFTVMGFYDDETKFVCLDLNAVVHLSHCQGALRKDNYVDCNIDKGTYFKGDMKIYVKNGNELWLHIDGRVGFVHWNKDIKVASGVRVDAAASGIDAVPQPASPPAIAASNVASVASSVPLKASNSLVSSLSYASVVAALHGGSDQALKAPSQPAEVGTA